MGEPFTWDWLCEIGFKHLEGAVASHLYIESFNYATVLEYMPYYRDRVPCRNDYWSLRLHADYRHNYIPWQIIPRTKAEVLALLDRLDIEYKKGE